MTPDKYKWEAEYVIEQGSKPYTYQVSYKEDGKLSETINEIVGAFGMYANYPIQYSSIELAVQAAHEHAAKKSAKRRQGMALIKLGKLP